MKKVKYIPIQGGINMIFPDGEVVWMAKGDIMLKYDFINKNNWELYTQDSKNREKILNN